MPTESFISNLNQLRGGSPWTRIVIVDQGGKGDYTTIESALTYVSGQTPTSTTPWAIILNPGVYNPASTISIPRYVSIIGYAGSGRGNNAEINFKNVTSGNLITLATTSYLINLTITWQFYEASAQDGNIVLIKDNESYSGTVNIEGCYLLGLTNSAVYTIHAIQSTSKAIAPRNCEINAVNLGGANGYPLYCNGGSFLVLNCILNGTARDAICTAGTLKLTNCSLVGSNGIERTGGAFSIWGTSTPSITGAITIADLATTTIPGLILESAAVADLSQTITDPPTQAEVQAITDKVDELLAALRAAGTVAT